MDNITIENITNIQYINIQRSLLKYLNDNTILDLFEKRYVYKDKNITINGQNIKIENDTIFGSQNDRSRDKVKKLGERLKTPLIIISGWNGDKKVVQIIKDFKPYLYIDKEKYDTLDENSKTILNNYFTMSDVIMIEKDEDNKYKTYKSIFNRDVYKVFYFNPKSTYRIRDMFRSFGVEVYEADIEFIRRFYIDMLNEGKIKEKSRKYKKVFIDIETTTEGGFPNYENPIQQITVVTIATEDKMYTFALDPEGKKDEVKEDEKGKIYIVSNEVRLVKYVFLLLQKLQGDLLLGWNVKFDIYYLISRTLFLLYGKKITDKIDNGTLNNIYFETKKEYVSFNFANIDSDRGKEYNNGLSPMEFYGRNTYQVLDMLTLYKEITFSELPSYSLEYVAKNVLGGEYDKKRIGNFTEEWKNNFDELIKYNRNDVELIRELERKEKMIDFYEEVRMMTHLPKISMATSRNKMIDNLILIMYKDKVFPYKSYEEKLNIEFKPQGEYVFIDENEKNKVFEKVYVLDFVSMYPNIIRSFNLSPEIMMDSTPSNPTNFIKLNVENEGRYIQLYFLKQEVLRGILPNLTDYMMKLKEKYTRLRDEAKNEEERKFYETRRFTTKTIINALYGVTEFPGFRLFDARLGATITYIGRELIKYVKKQLENMGFKVLYGDTDSVFIWKDGDFDINVVLKDVNEKIKLWVENLGGKCYLEMDVDKILEKVVFFKKKRYYYIKNGKIGYVGMDIKRTNTPPIITEGLKLVSEKYINNEDINPIIEEVKKRILEENDLTKFFEPLKLEKDIPTINEKGKVDKGSKKNGTYVSMIKSVKAVLNTEKVFGYRYSIGQKFYGIILKDVDKDQNNNPISNLYRTGEGDTIFAADNEHFDDNSYRWFLDHLNRERYIELFERKLRLLSFIKEEEKSVKTEENGTTLTDYI
jgi:DNA polymerase elongation subunit (family B)